MATKPYEITQSLQKALTHTHPSSPLSLALSHPTTHARTRTHTILLDHLASEVQVPGGSPPPHKRCQAEGGSREQQLLHPSRRHLDPSRKKILREKQKFVE